MFLVFPSFKKAIEIFLFLTSTSPSFDDSGRFVFQPVKNFISDVVFSFLFLKSITETLVNPI